MKFNSLFPKLGICFLGLSACATGKTIIVNSQSDVNSPLDDITTLREAVLAASAGDSVVFAAALAGKTVTLTEGQIRIATSINFTAPLLGGVSIAPSKLSPSRIFVVEEGAGGTITRLKFAGGFSAADGGAIWNAGQIIFESCEFVDNSAGENGGAIHNAGGAITLNDCIFSENTAGRGGAISNFSNGDLGVENGHFEGNEALGIEPFSAAGGAILAQESSTLISKCRFYGNTSTRSGLALATETGGSFRVRDTVIAGNIGNRAAVIAYETNLIMLDCSIQGNGGGGLNAQGGGLQSTLVNCTISGNASNPVRVADTSVDFKNCLIWDGLHGPSDPPGLISLILREGSATTFSHSLVQGLDLRGEGVGNLDGTDQVNRPNFVNPVDSDLAPTIEGNLTPSVEATVVNRGDLALANGLLDAAGNKRIHGASIDMGAFEVQRKVIRIDRAIGNGVANGSSWNTAFQTLSEGLEVAEEGDVLYLAGGIYSPDQGPGRLNHDVREHFRIASSLSFYGGFPTGGGPRDPASHLTILSGDLQGDDLSLDGITEDEDDQRGANAQNLLLIDAEAEGEVLFDGLVFTGVDGDRLDTLDQGVFSINSGKVTFSKCRIIGNRNLGNVRDCQLTFNQCEIFRNTGYGRLMRISDCGVEYINTRIEGNTRGIVLDACSLLATNLLYAGNTGRLEIRNPLFSIFINLTASGNLTAPVDITNGGSATFVNCLIWNNHTVTGPGASLYLGPGVDANFQHCLIQYYDLTAEGEGNFDGYDRINNPAFADPLHVRTAPTVGGNYQLSSRSPGIDAGDTSWNNEPVDLEGTTRMVGSEINLGAYEAVSPIQDADEDGLPNYWETENHDFGGLANLDPEGDDDGDGLNNLAEFCHGLDPRKSNTMVDYQRFLIVENGGIRYPAIAYRVNSAALGRWQVTAQTSLDLGANSEWANLILSFHDAVGFERIYHTAFPLDDARAQFMRVRISPVNPK